MGYACRTLFKQYAELCEEGGVQFMDFGYDKDFNDCIDGFIVVDLNLMKESKRKRYFSETKNSFVTKMFPSCFILRTIQIC